MSNHEYDYLVVGSGLYGATFARVMTDYGFKCLIIESREHIAGNVYTEKYDNIDIHKYGPHIFHTNDERIWNFMLKFTRFNNFFCRTKVNYQGTIYSFPINLMTLHQLFGVNNPKDALILLDKKRLRITDPSNLEDWALSQVGQEIYDIFIKGYTKKQWQRSPKDLPSFIIKRLPIRLNFDDNYFFDRFQGIPENGYTELVNKMLEGINIKLKTNYFENKDYFQNIAKNIVFTGKVDEFYNYKFGHLEYRTLKFENEYHEGDYQGNAVINYTHESIPYTRIVEHKHFKPEIKNDNTIITKEYPDSWSKEKIPYYPINDSVNMEIFKKYEILSRQENNVLFGGRLAEYRYYDMHQVVASALSRCKKILLSESLNFDIF